MQTAEESLANGLINFDQVPSFGAEEEEQDFPEEEAAQGPAVVPGGAVQGTSGVEQPEKVDGSRRTTPLYWVRVPKPPLGDDLLKGLQAEFQGHVAKLKTLNVRLGAKRDVTRELRRQMTVGRSLKEGSQPEYEEKLGRLQQLREMRKGFQAKSKGVKETSKGLECRSEAELDARIKELEGFIQYGQVSLKEEKDIVKNISKLQSQRQQVRELDTQKAGVAELRPEDESIGSMIAHLESEFQILKNERDQAQKIVSDIYAKLQVADKEYKEVEEEQAVLVKGKNDALAALEKAREENNAGLSEYRENRSFSLRIRDLVAAGALDEARTLAAEQVEAMTAKIGSDVAYAREYHAQWAAQRRYAVSDLLPESALNAKPRESSGGGSSGGGARSNGRERAAAVPPPKANGAEKARALIAALMSEAAQESGARSGSSGGGAKPVRAYEPDSDDEAHEQQQNIYGGSSNQATTAAYNGNNNPSQPSATPYKVPGAQREVVGGAGLPAPVARSQPKTTEAYRVEVPVIADVEFVLPVMSAPVTVIDAGSKDRLREEQRVKAAEAELRKRKKSELTEKKRLKAVEMKKKEAEACKSAKAAGAKEQADSSTPHAAAAQVQQHDGASRAAADDSAADAEVVVSAAGNGPTTLSNSSLLSGAHSTLKPAVIPIAKSQVTASAKRGPRVEPLSKRVKKLLKQHMVAISVAGIILLIALLLMYMLL